MFNVDPTPVVDHLWYWSELAAAGISIGNDCARSLPVLKKAGVNFLS